jgi:membrane protein implicated in regulation of membrane protease activity
MMGEIKVTGQDLLLSAASLAVIIGIALLILLIVATVFIFGSPLGIIAFISGLGIIGILIAISIISGFITIWYVIYALLKNFLSPKKENPDKGNYSMDRIKPS